MSTRLRAKLTAQGGLISRRDALDCGVTPSRLVALIRSGSLVTLRRGVYADGEMWAELDPYRARPRLEARAAALNMHRGWVLSHDSAALEWDLALIAPQPAFVHVTRPGYTSAWTRYGVKHHYAHYQASQRVDRVDVPVLDMARTVVDLGREHGEVACIVAADSALRRGVSRAALIEAYLPMSYWPHIVGVRSAIDFADGRAENAAESLGRVLVAELGLGDLDLQFPVRIGEGIAWCDIRVGNHIFEVDGRIKYRSTATGGVATRSVEDVLWEEKKRERLITSQGLGMSRVLWEDFWGHRRAAAKRRLLMDAKVTAERFGSELAPHLARSAAEIRGRFGWRDSIGGLGA